MALMHGPARVCCNVHIKCTARLIYRPFLGSTTGRARKLFCIIRLSRKADGRCAVSGLLLLYCGIMFLTATLDSDELQLQFQHARQPRRMLDDPLENYTAACLTRRGKGSPRLLLVASDRVSLLL